MACTDTDDDSSSALSIYSIKCTKSKNGLEADLILCGIDVAQTGRLHCLQLLRRKNDAEEEEGVNLQPSCH